MAVTRINHAIFTGTPNTGVDTTGATLIIVVITGVSLVGTITDSKGNTWTALNTLNTGPTRTLAAFYCINPTTDASHTFTAGTAGSARGVMVALNPTSPVFDTQNVGASSATATVQPGSLTPGGATNLIFSALGGDANTTIAINSSYNIGESQVNTPYGSQGAALGWLEQAAATAQNPTWTVGANGNTINATAFSFTFTGGGGGGSTNWGPMLAQQLNRIVQG